MSPNRVNNIQALEKNALFKPHSVCTLPFTNK